VQYEQWGVSDPFKKSNFKIYFLFFIISTKFSYQFKS
jgi:hypothetical protein